MVITCAPCAPTEILAALPLDYETRFCYRGTCFAEAARPKCGGRKVYQSGGPSHDLRGRPPPAAIVAAHALGKPRPGRWTTSNPSGQNLRFGVRLSQPCAFCGTSSPGRSADHAGNRGYRHTSSPAHVRRTGAQDLRSISRFFVATRSRFIRALPVPRMGPESFRRCCARLTVLRLERTANMSCRKEDQATSLFLVASGELRGGLSHAGWGKRIVAAPCSETTLFGEMALITGQPA